MADDKTQSDAQDRERINVHQDYELRDWSKSLGVTPKKLKEEVAAVGDRADKVREYLNGQMTAHHSPQSIVSRVVRGLTPRCGPC